MSSRLGQPVPPVSVAVGLVSKASASLIGQRLGAFEVQSLLGLGYMGEAYDLRSVAHPRDATWAVPAGRDALLI